MEAVEKDEDTFYNNAVADSIKTTKEDEERRWRQVCRRLVHRPLPVRG